MRALDTNVLLRLIIRDDAVQLVVAEQMIDEPFLLLPTVILEVVWVLESRFEMERARVVKEVRNLLGHIHAVMPTGEAVRWAVDRYEEGGDFADMLHVAFAGASDASQFATFDRRIAKFINEPGILVETLG